MPLPQHEIDEISKLIKAPNSYLNTTLDRATKLSAFLVAVGFEKPIIVAATQFGNEAFHTIDSLKEFGVDISGPMYLSFRFPNGSVNNVAALLRGIGVPGTTQSAMAAINFAHGQLMSGGLSNFLVEANRETLNDLIQKAYTDAFR